MGQEIGVTQFTEEIFKEFQSRLINELEILQSQLAKGVFSNRGDI